MNDIKIIYKYNIRVGYENISTLKSDDPNILLLIPELLEENKKKVEDYYKNLEFRKITTYSSKNGYSYRIYTFINGTLYTLVESGKSNHTTFPPMFSPELGPKTTTIVTHVTPGISDEEEYERVRRAYYKYKDTKWGFLFPEHPTFNPQGGRKHYKTVPVKPYDEKEEFYKHYKFIEPFEFHEGLAKSRKVFDFGKVRYGFIDTKGNVIVDYKYDDVMPFHEGLARVEKDLKFGFVNIHGKEVIPCIYAYAGEFHEGLVVVKKNGKYGYVDKFGNEVVPCQYDYADNFHGGLARVAKRKAAYIAEVGCIDKNGRIAIHCCYDELKTEKVYGPAEYISNKILTMQKYVEEHTNPNFDIPDYNQFMMRLGNYERMNSSGQHVQQYLFERMTNAYGKIKCFDLTKQTLFEVLKVEKQLKITNDNESVYLDEEGAKQLKKVLTKK